MTFFGISFSHDENRYMLVSLVILIALIVRSAKVRREALKLFGLSSEIVDFEAPVNRGFKNFLYLVGLFFACVAALGPQWGQKMHPVKAQGLDICFALDLSKSMLTEDLSPNRLGQAKNQLEIFLPRLGGDRAALVGFAGTAFVGAPLSVDHAALATFLGPMTPEIMTDQATSLSAATDVCMSALGLDAIKDRNQIMDDAAKLIVLITDGEETEADDTGAITRAEKLGVPIFAMAVGTAKGGPIAIRDNGRLVEYLKDPTTNQPVVSKLQDQALKKITEKTGGKLFYASTGVEAWNEFEKAIADYKRASRDAGTKLDKEERFQWPLLAAFLFLLWDFLLTETKWKWGLALLLGAMIPFRAQAAANDLDPGLVWWNNKGVRSFAAKDLKKADEEFLKALSEDASDLVTQYNWATNKLFAAVDPENPQKADPKQTDEALGQLEKIKQDPRLQGPQSEAFRKRLSYQLGQAYEMKNDIPKALDSYYGALDAPAAKDAKPSELDKKTKANISRLLIAPPQQNGGGGGGSDDKQDKDKSKGDGEDKQPKKYSQEKQKPKFTGTDLNEDQARQIMESVSGEEKEVLKRKAGIEAKEQKLKHKRDARDRGDSGHARPW